MQHTRAIQQGVLQSILTYFFRSSSKDWRAATALLKWHQHDFPDCLCTSSRCNLHPFFKSSILSRTIQRVLSHAWKVLPQSSMPTDAVIRTQWVCSGVPWQPSKDHPSFTCLIAPISVFVLWRNSCTLLHQLHLGEGSKNVMSHLSFPDRFYQLCTCSMMRLVFPNRNQRIKQRRTVHVWPWLLQIYHATSWREVK
jgi:hypothetical protein